MSVKNSLPLVCVIITIIFAPTTILNTSSASPPVSHSPHSTTTIHHKRVCRPRRRGSKHPRVCFRYTTKVTRTTG